eukprot:scaffold913_cov73-Phaeocystis_antarctica.AAC.1
MPHTPRARARGGLRRRGRGRMWELHSSDQRVGSTHRACFCACATRPRVPVSSAEFRAYIPSLHKTI